MNYKEYTVKVFNNGNKLWHLNDQLHREDGPAIEYPNGHKEWYLHGQKLSEKQFLEKTKKQKFSCEGKVIEIDGKKYKLTPV